MSSTSSVFVTGGLPLIGVAIGAGATFMSQQIWAREARRRSRAEARQAQRAEIKSAIASYLEVTRHIQTELYAREHGREFGDIPVMMEQLWLAHDQVAILCSDGLLSPLLEHAEAMNDVARHADRYPDWWRFVYPFKETLMNAIRDELKWPNAALPPSRTFEDQPEPSPAAVLSSPMPEVE